MAASSTKPIAPESVINKTPNVCGGSACIRATRIPVWSLVLWHAQQVTDARLLEMYPTLTPEDLAAVWDYYTAHRDEIDQDIRENEEA